MFKRIRDFINQHPEILLLMAGLYLYDAYECVKDYRKAVHDVVSEAVDIAKDAV